LRRPEAAHRDRPRAPEAAQGRHPRRGDLEPRCTSRRAARAHGERAEGRGDGPLHCPRGAARPASRSGAAFFTTEVVLMEIQKTDFLPSIQRLQERPPSPLGRALLWTLLALVAATLAWAALGRLDVVAVAEG